MEPKIIDYILQLPDKQADIVALAVNRIQEIAPEVTATFSFGLPFFHFHGMCMYVHVQKDLVYLGLCRGVQLMGRIPELVQGNRKMVAILPLPDVSYVESARFTAIVQIALDWNKEAKALKINMIKIAKKNSIK